MKAQCENSASCVLAHGNGYLLTLCRVSAYGSQWTPFIVEEWETLAYIVESFFFTACWGMLKAVATLLNGSFNIDTLLVCHDQQ